MLFWYTMPTMPIHVLAPDVAAKIAAGEVVERPANVAKELIENSLDAGATEIRVEIREGGQRLLRVTDNGCGIPAAEAPLAFTRHATSKLTTAEELYHLHTFGFRGEALYSIAAVSQLTLTTRSQDEAFGVQIRLEGGAIVNQSRAGTPVGTIVNVEQLFYNVPARQKFLRKPATEAGNIADVVQHYALAYPDRRLSLVVDGRLVFQSSGSGDLFDVLVKVYGLENARQMTPVGLPSASSTGANLDEARGLDDEVDFMALAGPPRTPRPAEVLPELAPAAQITGYASLPSLTRANRTSIHLFVNHRYIEDRTLTYAVVQAYHTLLPVGRYPIAVIMLHVDPAQIDVNVHPQKTEVRFVEERRLFNAVQKAVRRALVRHAPIPGLELAPPPQATPFGSDWSPSIDPGWAERRAAILGAGDQPHLDMHIPEPAPLPQASSDPGVIWSPPTGAPPSHRPRRPAWPHRHRRRNFRRCAWSVRSARSTSSPKGRKDSI